MKFSSGHYPNHLNPPDPSLGILVFFSDIKFKI